MIVLVYFEKAYTNPAAGDNLLSGETVHKSDRPRRLKHIAFVGGAAIDDGEIEVFYGPVKVANVANCVATDAILKDYLYPVGSQLVCPPGS